MEHNSGMRSGGVNPLPPPRVFPDVKRLLIRTVLFLAAPLLLVGATCVVNVARRGDRGPWTGEVVNTGPQAVFGVGAYARLLDADARELYPGRVGVLACPSKLLPGEWGAFEIYSTANDYPTPSVPPDEATPPLRAEIDGLAQENVGTGQARGDGLLVTLLARDAQTRSARVRLTNNAPGAYSQFTVCGILRDADGNVVSVGRADGPALPYRLLPGQSIDLTVPFDVMAVGELRFYALGLLEAPYTDCCPLGASTWRSVDTGPFSVLLPPGWEYRPQQGIDSFVGQFAGDGVVLSFDLGFTGGSPLQDDPAYSAHKETIGGYTAVVYAPTGAQGRTGVSMRVAESSPPFGYPTALGISGMVLTPEQQAVALQIFRSVRFKPVRGR